LKRLFASLSHYARFFAFSLFRLFFPLSLCTRTPDIAPEQRERSREKVYQLWQTMVRSTITGKILPIAETCGLVLAEKKWGINFTFWTRVSNDTGLVEKGTKYLKQLLRDFHSKQIRFVPHSVRPRCALCARLCIA
jgi:hypothetical protein